MLYFTISCAGLGSVTENPPKKSRLRYEIYLTGVPERDTENYLNVMLEKEYYEAHKLLRIHADYAEILYWAKELPAQIYQDTQLFFADYPVTLSGRIIFVGRKDE
jgi:hypothetical protein